ncbi:MAG: YcaO-like family protein [Bacteroidota bacterium]
MTTSTYLLHPRLRARTLCHGAIELVDPDLETVVLVTDVAHALTTLVHTGCLPEDLSAEAVDDLEALANAGFLLRLPPGLMPDVALRWWDVGVAPTKAATLRRHRVSVAALDVTAKGIAAALADYGLHPSRWTEDTLLADVGLILADDAACVDALPCQVGLPTLVVQTNAAFPWAVWLEPGRTACPCCLHRHLQVNTPTAPLVVPRQGNVLGMSAERIAALLAEGLARAAWTAEVPELTTLGNLDDAARHTVRRVPTCPACGSPPAEKPPTWTSRPKAPGSHRWASLDEAFNRLETIHSPIVGISSDLPTLAEDPSDQNKPQESEGTSSVWGPRQGLGVRYRALWPVQAIDGLHHSITLVAGGTGPALRHARVKARGEAAERASGAWWAERPHVVARAADLKGRVYTPEDLLGFRADQYADRATWNARTHRFLRAPERFDPALPTAWIQAYPLPNETGAEATDEVPVWVPAGYAFYQYDFGDGPIFANADSNGCAAGSCLEEAALFGLYEIVERDSIALWVRSGAVRPGVDLRTAARVALQDAPGHYASRGRSLAVIDVTSDIGVPAFIALSHRLDGLMGWALGFGCHLDPEEAVSRAVGEVTQSVHEVEDGSDALAWGDVATVEAFPHLAPDSNVPAIDLRCWPAAATDDVLGDLHEVAARVRRAGFEPYVIDQTHPLVGIPVVRVVVPGLGHFWRRLGTPRLATTPYELGWVSAPGVINDPDWTEVTV